MKELILIPALIRLVYNHEDSKLCCHNKEILLHFKNPLDIPYHTKKPTPTHSSKTKLFLKKICLQESKPKYSVYTQYNLFHFINKVHK